MRYVIEKTGPELRQYLFDDNDGEPFNREEYLHMVMPGKYLNSVIGFGSKRDFEKSGYYIRNAMFTKQNEEIHVDNSNLIDNSTSPEPHKLTSIVPNDKYTIIPI